MVSLFDASNKSHDGSWLSLDHLRNRGIVALQLGHVSDENLTTTSESCSSMTADLNCDGVSRRWMCDNLEGRNENALDVDTLGSSSTRYDWITDKRNARYLRLLRFGPTKSAADVNDVRWLWVVGGEKELVLDNLGENAATVFWYDDAIDAARIISSLRREETKLVFADDVCISIISTLSMRCSCVCIRYLPINSRGTRIFIAMWIENDNKLIAEVRRSLWLWWFW